MPHQSESHPKQKEERKPYRINNPGMTDREHRRKEALTLIEIELGEKYPHLSAEEVHSKAAKELDRRFRHHPKFEQKYAETAPSSTTPPRASINQYVEMAAVMRLPLIQWLWQWLLRSLRGRPGKRTLALALFFHMVCQSGKPDVLNTLKSFHASAMRDFCYGTLERPKDRSGIYRAIESMLTGRWPQVCRYINAELWRQLVAQKNDDGTPRHPNAGVYLVADGSYLEAHAQQRSSRDKDGPHEAQLRGRRKKAAFTAHKLLRGYKLMVISDLATGLPLVFKLYPSTVNEAQATLELLERLFHLLPELPAEYLVADGAYHQHEFCYDLEFKWGLHPVVPKGEDNYDATKHKYVDPNHKDPARRGQDGVPTCDHGLMKLKDSDRFWSGARRAEEGIARGELAPQTDARLRWVCVDGHKRCGQRYTYPRDDARIYTYLPRAGTHNRVALREALAVRRNSIEGIFAQLKGNGHGGPRQWRAFWAEDQENEWLLYVGCMLMTCRRLVHETGDYVRMWEEAERFNLLNESGGSLSELERKRMLHSRQASIGDLDSLTPPPLWEADATEGGYCHELRIDPDAGEAEAA